MGRIRRLNANGLPVELDQVEAEAADYAEARDAAAAKVPDGRQLLSWTVPDHLPG